jgi:hypothetical protein
MDISRTLKDILLITPFLIALGIGVIMNTLIYLFLSFVTYLIFIYEKLKWN